MENLDSNLQKLGSRLYLFEGNSTEILQGLTKELIEQGYSPKLFFNRDVRLIWDYEFLRFQPDNVSGLISCDLNGLA